MIREVVMTSFWGTKQIMAVPLFFQLIEMEEKNVK